MTHEIMTFATISNDSASELQIKFLYCNHLNKLIYLFTEAFCLVFNGNSDTKVE